MYQTLPKISIAEYGARALQMTDRRIGVGAGGDKGIDPPSFESRGIILPTFQAKMCAKITLHGR